MSLVFDIETGPLPFEKIEQFMPTFERKLGAFDPASVKCGNLKDENKIKTKITDARNKHAMDVEKEKAA
ncbi:MAG: hypothetical protein MJA83_06565, partial [Gammaproteobacteria bacterium]|nr:hypothetical protein [Gammaproteobacteria bacterium]